MSLRQYPAVSATKDVQAMLITPQGKAFQRLLLKNMNEWKEELASPGVHQDNQDWMLRGKIDLAREILDMIPK